MALNYDFLDQVKGENFWPPTDIYAFQEMESNDTRLARIAEFEANAAAHQEANVTVAEWNEITEYALGLGCKIGCMPEYIACMQNCSGWGCAICQAYLSNCFNNCNQQ